LTIGSARYKSGEGRLDYTPEIPFLVTNYPGGKIDIPVALLVDKFSVSCAEISAMTVKLLPKGHVIGERTYGGTSALTDNRVFNGGSFTGDLLWTVSKTPSCMFKCADGNFYEEVGVPPDEPVAQDWGLFLSEMSSPGTGRDNVLEAAITHLGSTF
jgi:C-terminal processing protease CtpA/Prc